MQQNSSTLSTTHPRQQPTLPPSFPPSSMDDRPTHRCRPRQHPPSGSSRGCPTPGTCSSRSGSRSHHTARCPSRWALLRSQRRHWNRPGWLGRIPASWNGTETILCNRPSALNHIAVKFVKKTSINFQLQCRQDFLLEGGDFLGIVNQCM